MYSLKIRFHSSLEGLSKTTESSGRNSKRARRLPTESHESSFELSADRRSRAMERTQHTAFVIRLQGVSMAGYESLRLRFQAECSTLPKLLLLSKRSSLHCG